MAEIGKSDGIVVMTPERGESISARRRWDVEEDDYEAYGKPNVHLIG